MQPVRVGPCVPRHTELTRIATCHKAELYNYINTYEVQATSRSFAMRLALCIVLALCLTSSNAYPSFQARKSLYI